MQKPNDHKMKSMIIVLLLVSNIKKYLSKNVKNIFNKLCLLNIYWIYLSDWLSGILYVFRLKYAYKSNILI